MGARAPAVTGHQPSHRCHGVAPPPASRMPRVRSVGRRRRWWPKARRHSRGQARRVASTAKLRRRRRRMRFGHHRRELPNNVRRRSRAPTLEIWRGSARQWLQGRPSGGRGGRDRGTLGRSVSGWWTKVAIAAQRSPSEGKALATDQHAAATESNELTNRTLRSCRWRIWRRSASTRAPTDPLHLLATRSLLPRTKPLAVSAPRVGSKGRRASTDLPVTLQCSTSRAATTAAAAPQ
mmetsp:Transcript_17460/g.47763  ORF Transcript_17460/g.47763 Transcript_17460/m.47763 type:complete len:236 (-) Transcript_17460:3902-4609(-)